MESLKVVITGQFVCPIDLLGENKFRDTHIQAKAASFQRATTMPLH